MGRLTTKGLEIRPRYALQVSWAVGELHLRKAGADTESSQQLQEGALKKEPWKAPARSANLQTKPATQPDGGYFHLVDG